MSPAFRIPVLIVGAVLLLAAALGGKILGTTSPTGAAKFVRIAIAVIGVALISWALQSYLGSPTQPVREPLVATAPSAPKASPLDPVQVASSELIGCPVAAAPSLPEGGTASLEQIETSRAAFQAYDAATNAYVQCVDTTIGRVAKRFEGTASESDLRALKTFGVRAHNVAIDKEQAIADQLNTQIRAYKAKHTG